MQFDEISPVYSGSILGRYGWEELENEKIALEMEMNDKR